MGTITISMKDQDEKILRNMAFKRYGKTKGAISKVITEAITNLDEKEDEFLTLARKGISIGKIDMKNLRKDIYGKDYRV